MGERIQNWLCIDDKPVRGNSEECWKNTKTDTRISVIKNKSHRAFTSDSEWLVASGDVVIHGADTFTHARQKATEYMENNPEPPFILEIEE